METAGAEDIPEDAERKGLGTPATRAGTIEKLVQKGFMERKGDKKTRYLVSTDKGNSLIAVMPEQIQSASMTADWEQKLLRMEHGDYEAQDFMREITDMISGLVQNYEAVKGAETLKLHYWTSQVEKAESLGEVKEVCFGFQETENLGLSREQCQKFWEVVDQKESSLSPPSTLADLQAKKEKSEKEMSSKPKTKASQKKSKKQKKEESR